MVEQPTHLILSPRWFALTIPIALTTIMSSVAGAFGHAYANETASWAAQCAGQDAANLFVIVPAFSILGYWGWRGSLRALLLWIGLLMYLCYSFAIYAFCVHFNAFFLMYVATLGLTFYTLLGVTLTFDRDAVRRAMDHQTHARSMAVLLLIVALAFAVLWLTDIVSAMLRGTVPRGIAAIGLPVNPVHVMDLAFALPGLFLTGVGLRQSQTYSLFFAVPCSTFLIAMGVAILTMAWTMNSAGVAESAGLPLPIVVIIVGSVYGTVGFLKGV